MSQDTWDIVITILMLVVFIIPPAYFMGVIATKLFFHEPDILPPAPPNWYGGADEYRIISTTATDRKYGYNNGMPEIGDIITGKLVDSVTVESTNFYWALEDLEEILQLVTLKDIYE